MPSFSTPAILLRRLDFGDYDVILTFFSLSYGKISAIAKSAKKSTKRFSGILELFSALKIVYGSGRRKGMPVLQEAVLVEPFPKIRANIKKTAYASYWAEMIHEWAETGEKQAKIYHLLMYVLEALDRNYAPDAALSIIFQIKFLTFSGYAPNLRHCMVCQKQTEAIKESNIRIDLKRGGIVCSQCAAGSFDQMKLQKGTVKQLQWIQRTELKKVDRIRFTTQALDEGLKFLEVFGPYHLGKKPRSLTFLEQIRE